MSPTRRDFLATSAVAAAGALAHPSLALGQQAAPAQQPRPVFTPLRGNVGLFSMRGGTIGWLVNDGAVVVVDSQYPAEAQACLAGLNERSGNRPVQCLINTHHHGDHTGGNVAFRGIAGQVVAHVKADEHMRQPPGGQPPADALFPDTTFTESWATDAGDERVVARWYGRAHTSGDAVVTFERANVVHMGDLVFHRRHPVVDRAAGASLKSWATVLERVVADHTADTIYIFGHAGAVLPVWGGRADLMRFRDYLGAVLAFVESNIRAGRTKEEVLAMREPLKGFEDYGAFGAAGARETLTCAVEEVTTGA
ncbi:MAG TPA: MBL fold metallo-hydrolase [Longimicrobiales bacterium]|nr:MBL fold metallo-hydrolase [Longimicrobiales bacterium]